MASDQPKGSKSTCESAGNISRWRVYTYYHMAGIYYKYKFLQIQKKQLLNQKKSLLFKYLRIVYLKCMKSIII